MDIDKFVAWFQSHKTVLGAFFLGLATVVGGAGTIYHNDSLIHAAGLIALIGTTLAGAGAAKSDQFYREKTDVIKTGLDRRGGDAYIPVEDLRKLVGKDDVDPTEPDTD